MKLQILDNDVFNGKEAYKAQEKYCEQHNLPFFAPYKCHGHKATVNTPHEVFAIISINYASLHHITECPICRRSFCD